MDQEHVQEPSTFPVYSKEFLLKPHLVLEHAHKMKKQLDDFIHAFSKRAEAEMTYKKNLCDSAKILEKYIDENSDKCVSYIASAFKVGNEQRANQSMDLAETLKSEVISPMEEASKAFGQMIKGSEKSVKKLNKEYNYFLDTYRRSLENYNQNDIEGKELIISKHIYRFTSQFPQDKKNKLVTKTMEGIKEKKNYENVYRTSVNQYNEIIEVYRKEVTEILNNLEQEERTHIKSESDAIRKLIVAEVSMFKNVEYDLINISKQMEKMYAESDILTFREEANRIVVPEESLKNLTIKTVEADKSLLTKSLKNAEEDYYPWLLNAKKNKLLREVIEERMRVLLESDKTDKGDKSDIEGREKSQTEVNGKTEKEQSGQKQNEEKKGQSKKESEDKEQENKLDQLWSNLPNELFNPPSCKKMDRCEILAYFKEGTEIIYEAWRTETDLKNSCKENLVSLLNKNHFTRILLYLFIEQFRIEHFVQMKWSNYERAGEIIKVIIDTCESLGDVFTIKGLLALAFTFYAIENESAKKLLYQTPSITSCEVWKREDYWEASIFESTFEEMANFNLQKGETQAETLLREKNMIFSQLASYCHYMLMLGCTSKNVRRIVGRYCRLYEMSEDQNRDLSKMISNTTRQLKETQLAKMVNN